MVNIMLRSFLKYVLLCTTCDTEHNNNKLHLARLPCQLDCSIVFAIIVFCTFLVQKALPIRVDLSGYSGAFHKEPTG